MVARNSSDRLHAIVPAAPVAVVVHGNVKGCERSVLDLEVQADAVCCFSSASCSREVDGCVTHWCVTVERQQDGFLIAALDPEHGVREMSVSASISNPSFVLARPLGATSSPPTKAGTS